MKLICSQPSARHFDSQPLKNTVQKLQLNLHSKVWIHQAFQVLASNSAEINQFCSRIPYLFEVFDCVFQLDAVFIFIQQLILGQHKLVLQLAILGGQVLVLSEALALLVLIQGIQYQELEENMSDTSQIRQFFLLDFTDLQWQLQWQPTGKINFHN